MEDADVCIPVGHVLRMRWLEPLVATLSFALSINFFRIVEARGNARAATTAIFDLRKSTRLLRGGAAYWLGIYALSKVLPRASVEWGCSVPKIAADLCAGVVAYDFVYYWLHRTMHRFPKFGKLVAHVTHHTPRALRAHHVLEHSFVDGSLQVLVNIFVQRYGLFGPRNWLARLLHNVFVTYLLTESHALLDDDHDDDHGGGALHGEDQQSKTKKNGSVVVAVGEEDDATKIRWKGLSGRFPRIFKGALLHRLHHSHAGPPYQQFFGYLDDLFSPAPVIPAAAPKAK